MSARKDKPGNPRKGKSGGARKGKKPASLLIRLLGGVRRPEDRKAKTRKRRNAAAAGDGPGGGKGTHAPPSASAERSAPLTPRERSIAEVKQMAKIGQRDPQRLAQLLAALLAKERSRQQQDRERFEQQVWDIVQRREQDDAEADGAGAPEAETDDGSTSGDDAAPPGET